MRKQILLFIMVFGLLVVSGCGKEKDINKVVLTAGFEKDEVFRIESMSCSKQELLILLANTKNLYKSVYGEEIFEKNFNGITLNQSIKETVLAQISQVKTMNLLAERQQVSLDEAEQTKVKEASQKYVSTLSDDEKKIMGVTLDIVEELYTEYALADKVYRHIIRDINPEISDDEARTVTVQHILFKTYEVDGTGEKIEYSEEAKAKAYAEAVSVLKLAKQADTDFEQLILNYSDSEEGTISFGKGEMELSFEEVAFDMEKEEISDVIETSYGYHIVKCINTFNREETDANKIKIVEKRRQEVFGQEYETYAGTLTKKLNEDLWERIKVPGEEIVTQSFYEIYKEYFRR